jgi:spore germination cell wall hydrolase CwlJ-like protein
MTPTELLATLLFSETKDLEDAKGVANVVLHRVSRPERFGGSIEEVILSPYQFSGVNSNEWKKAETKQFKNKDEENIYKSFLQVANMAVRGTLEDNVNGADHYANLKISNPKFSRVYPKVAKQGQHTYFKEK